MKDLWRMDNERGYWISVDSPICDSVSRTMQFSEMLERVGKWNRSTIEISLKKSLRSQSQKCWNVFDKFRFCPLKDSVNYNRSCRSSYTMHIRSSSSSFFCVDVRSRKKVPRSDFVAYRFDIIHVRCEDDKREVGENLWKSEEFCELKCGICIEEWDVYGLSTGTWRTLSFGLSANFVMFYG